MTIKSFKQLIKIANILDVNKYHDEADSLTKIAKKLVLSLSIEEKREMMNFPPYEKMEEFENSPEFKRYQILVQQDANFEDQNMLKVLKEKLDDIFRNTDMELYSEDFLNDLIMKRFTTTDPSFTIVEEVYEDLANDLANNAEFETSRDRSYPVP